MDSKIFNFSVQHIKRISDLLLEQQNLINRPLVTRKKSKNQKSVLLPFPNNK